MHRKRADRRYWIGDSEDLENTVFPPRPGRQSRHTNGKIVKRATPQFGMKTLVIASVLVLLLAASVTLFVFAYFNSDFHEEVTYPAYLSYVAECVPNGEEILEERGYAVVGRTSFTFEGDTLTNISVDILPGADESTTPHEQCHVRQGLAGKIVPCKKKIRYYLNEFECYLDELR